MIAFLKFLLSLFEKPQVMTEQELKDRMAILEQMERDENG